MKSAPQERRHRQFPHQAGRDPLFDRSTEDSLMNQKLQMFPKTTPQVLLACGLGLGILSVISCSSSETKTLSDGDITVQGSGDGGSVRDVLRIDGANSPDIVIPAAEAGAPDAAVRLDLQTTPDVVAVEAPILNSDVYQIPEDVAAAQPETAPVHPDAIVYTRDVFSLVDVSPSDSDSTSVASCSQNAEVCTDYTAAEVVGGIQSSCVSPGVYKSSPCPTAGRIGSCTITGHTGNVLIDRFYTIINCTTTGPTACSSLCAGGGFASCVFTCG
jgi:hypothetical protein